MERRVGHPMLGLMLLAAALVEAVTEVARLAAAAQCMERLPQCIASIPKQREEHRVADIVLSLLGAVAEVVVRAGELGLLFPHVRCGADCGTGSLVSVHLCLV